MVEEETEISAIKKPLNSGFFALVMKDYFSVTVSVGLPPSGPSTLNS